MALEAPLVVAIDDLQWADPSTITALRFATRHLRDVPVSFVVAFRPVPRDDALHRFLDSSLRDGALHVTLGPLDEHTVADLVEDRLGLPPGPGLQSLVASAGGNPFYVTELIDALAADGHLRTTDGAVDADVTSTPVAFRTAIIRYVRFLGEPQMALLRWAAVLGSRFSPADLASVSGTAVSDLLPVLDDAARAGILIDDRGRLAFRHELLRSALYDDMGTAIRQSLHLEAARALAAAAPRRSRSLTTSCDVGDIRRLRDRDTARRSQPDHRSWRQGRAADRSLAASSHPGQQIGGCRRQDDRVARPDRTRGRRRRPRRTDATDSQRTRASPAERRPRSRLRQPRGLSRDTPTL